VAVIAGKSYTLPDSATAGTIQALGDLITKNETAGLTVNPALNFDQATLDHFLTTAQSKWIHTMPPKLLV